MREGLCTKIQRRIHFCLLILQKIKQYNSPNVNKLFKTWRKI